MVPEELFKRRPQHNNTPENIMLIISNCIVVSVGAAMCISNHHIHWFFWVIVGLLALYNVYSIRRNYEEYNKASIIAYVISLVAITGLVLVLQYS